MYCKPSPNNGVPGLTSDKEFRDFDTLKKNPFWKFNKNEKKK